MSYQEYIPVTDFLVKDPYDYLEGFGNYHKSETVPGAIPLVNNSPQRPPLDLRTEKLSGSAFVVPRHLAVHTWVYRVNPSVIHGRHVPYHHELQSSNPSAPTIMTPDSKAWGEFLLKEGSNWFGQRLVGTTGSPSTKTGLATWVYNVVEDMKPNTAFASLDGETLIVPQTGSLDITTELGKLLVRGNEIAVIPRGVRYSVKLVDGTPSRGFICELYQGHFRLPELGIMGTSGAAHARDFQIPKAYLDGEIVEKNGVKAATSNKGKWTIISRLDYKLWSCEQEHTPFDVAGWHGTLYPYKYDLARFDFLSNVHFDHKDPSAHTVLTVPAYGKAPHTSVIDLIIFGKRNEASIDTHPLPWYHRNTMNEFSFATAHGTPATKGSDGPPFAGAFLAGAVTAHGPSEEEYRILQKVDTSKPALATDAPMTVVMFETECPMYLSEWALDACAVNFHPPMSSVLQAQGD